jgi:hypothetical protein
MRKTDDRQWRDGRAHYRMRVLKRTDRACDSLTLVLGEALGEATNAGGMRLRRPARERGQVDYSSFLH